MFSSSTAAKNGVCPSICAKLTSAFALIRVVTIPMLFACTAAKNGVRPFLSTPLTSAFASIRVVTIPMFSRNTAQDNGVRPSVCAKLTSAFASIRVVTIPMFSSSTAAIRSVRPRSSAVSRSRPLMGEPITSSIMYLTTSSGKIFFVSASTNVSMESRSGFPARRSMTSWTNFQPWWRPPLLKSGWRNPFTSLSGTSCTEYPGSPSSILSIVSSLGCNMAFTEGNARSCAAMKKQLGICMISL